MPIELTEKIYTQLGFGDRRHLVKCRAPGSLVPSGVGSSIMHLRSDDQAAFAATEKVCYLSSFQP